jgi:type I restriction enzyme, S subunit
MKEEQNINGLPKGWKWVKLQDIVSILGDGLHGTPAYSDDGDYHFINGNNLSNGKIIIKENTKKVCHKQFDKHKKDLTDKTILVSINGTIGNVAFYKNEKVILGKSACYFNVKADTDKYYIALLLKGERFLRYANNSATGSTIKNVSLKAMREFELPLPPKETQQQIVSKIEELFSELDKSIEELKTAQLQLKVYRQAVLKWAFEGKLTNEGVKNEKLPQGWKLVKTKDVIEIINNGYTPTREFLSDGSGEIPFIKVYNLNFDGSLNFAKNPTFIPKAIHQKDLKRSICFPGDVLINIVGPPLGKVSVVTNQYPEWNINQAIVMFRPNEKVLSKYLSYFLQNHVTINWLEGTSKATAGQWNVKVSTCREIPFPFCSIDEQQHLIQEIESRLSVCDKIEETITNSLKQAEALRQSILKKAFEGKLI